MLGKLPKFYDDRLLVGIETSDDAAVYRVNEDTAVIQTVDFFTPIVDDPFTFGQIAAANALSDVYAMGGKPVLALNIAAFPNCLDPAILGDILAGGADKVKEAGAVLAGGHTIQDDEPKYGLCVTGFVHPDRIIRNYGAKAGDVLILTKPIGSGLVNTAVKAEMAETASMEEASMVMRTLNKAGGEAMEGLVVNACTDVTGFGLAGHATEMAEGSDVSLEIHMSKVPIITGADEYAAMGLVPAGAYRNRNYFGAKVSAEAVEESRRDMAFDPQTSGGLLISAPPESAAVIMERLNKTNGTIRSAVIGRVIPPGDKRIYIME